MSMPSRDSKGPPPIQHSPPIMELTPVKASGSSYIPSPPGTPAHKRPTSTAARLSSSIDIQLGTLRDHILSLQKGNTALRKQSANEELITTLQNETKQLRTQIATLQGKNDIIHKQHYEQQIQIRILLESEKEFASHIEGQDLRVLELEQQIAEMEKQRAALKQELHSWEGVAVRISGLANEISVKEKRNILSNIPTAASGTKRKADDGLENAMALPAAPSGARGIKKKVEDGPEKTKGPPATPAVAKRTKYKVEAGLEKLTTLPAAPAVATGTKVKTEDVQVDEHATQVQLASSFPTPVRSILKKRASAPQKVRFTSPIKILEDLKPTPAANGRPSMSTTLATRVKAESASSPEQLCQKETEAKRMRHSGNQGKSIKGNKGGVGCGIDVGMIIFDHELVRGGSEETV